MSIGSRCCSFVSFFFFLVIDLTTASFPLTKRTPINLLLRPCFLPFVSTFYLSFVSTLPRIYELLLNCVFRFWCFMLHMHIHELRASTRANLHFSCTFLSGSLALSFFWLKFKFCQKIIWPIEIVGDCVGDIVLYLRLLRFVFRPPAHLLLHSRICLCCMYCKIYEVKCLKLSILWLWLFYM